MKPNIGSVDKTLRIILGLAVLSLIVWGPQSWWGLLGLIPLVTGLVNFCPLYALIGFSSAQQPKGTR